MILKCVSVLLICWCKPKLQLLFQKCIMLGFSRNYFQKSESYEFVTLKVVNLQNIFQKIFFLNYMY